MKSEPKLIHLTTTVEDEKPEAKPVSIKSTINESIPMSEAKTKVRTTPANPIINLLMLFLVVILGIVTGFGLSKAVRPKAAGITKTADQVTTQGIKVGDVVGSQDTKAFKDSAQGVLVKGGTDSGEGSHHLMRPGGPSQDVYLTSSTMGLDQFEGTEVKVWGETYAAQKAGWLMDVGRLEVIQLNAPEPYQRKTD